MFLHIRSTWKLIKNRKLDKSDKLILKLHWNFNFEAPLNRKLQTNHKININFKYSFNNPSFFNILHLPSKNQIRNQDYWQTFTVRNPSNNFDQIKPTIATIAIFIDENLRTSSPKMFSKLIIIAWRIRYHISVHKFQLHSQNLHLGFHRCHRLKNLNPTTTVTNTSRNNIDRNRWRGLSSECSSKRYCMIGDEIDNDDEML